MKTLDEHQKRVADVWIYIGQRLLRKIAELLIIYVFIQLFIQLFVHGPNGDDSDKSFFERSGMRVMTDYKTGCQYFSSPYGGITPRLEPNGQHVGCRH